MQDLCRLCKHVTCACSKRRPRLGLVTVVTTRPESHPWTVTSTLSPADGCSNENSTKPLPDVGGQEVRLLRVLQHSARVGSFLTPLLRELMKFTCALAEQASCYRFFSLFWRGKWKKKTDAYITPNNKHFSFIFKIMPISVDLFNLFHNPFLALYGGIQGFKALKRRVLINKFFYTCLERNSFLWL